MPRENASGADDTGQKPRNMRTCQIRYTAGPSRYTSVRLVLLDSANGDVARQNLERGIESIIAKLANLVGHDKAQELTRGS